MKYKKLAVTLAALAVLATGSLASAQTTTPTTTPPTESTTTTPGVPNTGSGGDAALNWLLLGVSGAAVLGGVAYLTARPRSAR
jgi:hypothetical protein